MNTACDMLYEEPAKKLFKFGKKSWWTSKFVNPAGTSAARAAAPVRVSFAKMDAQSSAASTNPFAAADKIADALRELHNDFTFLPPYRSNAIDMCVSEINRLYEANRSA